jgi:hypothetical protein
LKRKKVFGILVLLSALLFVPLVFSSGFLNIVGNFSGSEAPASPSSTPTVFFVPVRVVDEGLQPGSPPFTVHLNVSGPDDMDLFAWQINVTWDPSILSVNRIYMGEFLNRTESESKTSSFALDGWVINQTDNVAGSVSMAESILGGVPGINGSGWLVSIEFIVVGYGSTDLSISRSGLLPTTLLSSTVPPEVIEFTETGGYFSNKATGDLDGDRDVDGVDFGLFAPAYGSVVGQPAYNREADLDFDGDVDGIDFGLFAPNYGRVV